MVQEMKAQKMEILDLKNEIENLKLTISGIRFSIACYKNKNQTAKLKSKEHVLNKRLRALGEKRKRLEKQFSITFKTERREEF